MCVRTGPKLHKRVDLKEKVQAALVWAAFAWSQKIISFPMREHSTETPSHVSVTLITVLSLIYN